MDGGERFLDAGGRSTLRRVGVERHPFGDAYVSLVRMRWRRLVPLLFVAYLALVAAFAWLFWLEGDGIAGGRPGSFTDAFNLSVETFSTIGYGALAPRSAWAHLLVFLEAFVGMLAVAITAGLAFAKFSRPTARVVFSSRLVIGPIEGVPTLLLRLANALESNVVEAQVHLAFVRDERTREGLRFRRFHDLALVRSWTPLFALTWTVMHPIDERSPLRGATPESLMASNAEFVLTMTGLDETLSHTVHARAAWGPRDLAWNHAFADVFEDHPDGRRVNFARLHDVVPIG